MIVKNKLEEYMALFVCVFFLISLFISIPLNNISIGLMIVFAISRKEFVENLKQAIKSFYFQAFFIFIAITIFSLLYTENIDYGLKVLERHITFILLPILIVGFNHFITKEFIHKINIIFALTLIIVVILSALYSLNLANWKFSFDVLYRDNIVLLTKIQAMYLAMYISYLGIWATDIAIDKVKENKWLSLIIWISIILFAFIMNILLATRMTIAAMFLSIILVLILKTKKIIPALIILAVSITLFLGAIQLSPKFKYRYTEVLNTTIKPPVGHQHTSVNLRFAQWTCSYELFTSSSKNFFLGQGIGDVQDQLNACYRSHKDWSDVLNYEQYNSHCQYLQTFATLGLLGFCALLIMLFYPLYKNWKIQNFTAFGFILLIITSAVTESLFLNQKGIVFFSFFSAIFVANYLKNKSNNTVNGQ